MFPRRLCGLLAALLPLIPFPAPLAAQTTPAETSHARAGIVRQLVCRGKSGINLGVERDTSPDNVGSPGTELEFAL